MRTSIFGALGCASVMVLGLTGAGSADGDIALVTPVSYAEPKPTISGPPSIPVTFPGAEALPPSVAPAALSSDMPVESAEQAKVPPAVASAPAMGEDELHCLAVGIYHEARGERREGKLAVAQVILNRAHSGRFPRSVCGVVTQPAQFPGIRANWSPRESAIWREAREVAREAAEGERIAALEGAMYFHASHVRPGWRKAPVATIGNHLFYR